MARARKLCPTAGCSNFAPCKTHPRGAWAASKRSDHITLSGSKQQKRARAVLIRDDGRCHVCGEYGADEADHVIPVTPEADPAGVGGPDRIYNMAAIHSRPCHAEKTAAEAARARARTRGGTSA